MSLGSDFVAIVSGLPRSGTSLMMQMVDAGGIPALTDNIRKADVDNPKGYYEFEAVKQTKKDASWLKQAGGKVVKMVHLLLLDLPPGYEYRVVFMRRHLDEVVKSQDVMLERLGKEGGSLSVDKLKEVFQAQIGKVDQWVAERPNFRMIHVSYNDLLRDPRPQLERISELMDGRLSVDKMLSCIDPSLYRQRAN